MVTGPDGGLAEDLVGALRLVGGLREEEVQSHVDRILEAQQVMEGMVASIHHETDGDCPSSVC
jgi:hypothetical protein